MLRFIDTYSALTPHNQSVRHRPQSCRAGSQGCTPSCSRWRACDPRKITTPEGRAAYAACREIADAIDTNFSQLTVDVLQLRGNFLSFFVPAQKMRCWTNIFKKMRTRTPLCAAPQNLRDAVLSIAAIFDGTMGFQHLMPRPIPKTARDRGIHAASISSNAPGAQTKPRARSALSAPA
jgi:hypothetical protein